jgi:hypothetical protein
LNRIGAKGMRRSVVPLEIACKITKKFVGPIDLYRRGHDCEGHAVQIFFCLNMNLMGIKDAEFYVYFRNINLS